MFRIVLDTGKKKKSSLLEIFKEPGSLLTNKRKARRMNGFFLTYQTQR
jgi:hypothetical protein